MKNRNNKKRKQKEKTIDIAKTKKDATAFIIIGVILFVGILLFFTLFYRPFVPWKKIVCSEEKRPYITENAGTCIFDEDIREVTYFYEMDGVKYKKVFDMNTVPYQRWPNESVAYTIYVNKNNFKDVKPGNRGGIDIIILFIVFIITGGYMIGISFYKFNQIKKQKNIRAKK